MSAMRVIRIATWALVVALTAATLVVLWRGDDPTVASDEVTIGGPFSLVDANGQPVTEKALAGRPYAMFFGFTHCPEVCPTTLSELTVMMETLGPVADKFDVYFVTVDPARDDVQAIKDYLSAFDPRIKGLTGTEDAIASMIKEYRVFARKVPTDDGDYTMDHTAGIFLFGPDGRFRGTIAYGEKEDDAVAKLKRLVES